MSTRCPKYRFSGGLEVLDSAMARTGFLAPQRELILRIREEVTGN
jgi:hypothetical protein